MKVKDIYKKLEELNDKYYSNVIYKKVLKEYENIIYYGVLYGVYDDGSEIDVDMLKIKEDTIYALKEEPFLVKDAISEITSNFYEFDKALSLYDYSIVEHIDSNDDLKGVLCRIYPDAYSLVAEEIYDKYFYEN